MSAPRVSVGGRDAKLDVSSSASPGSSSGPPVGTVGDGLQAGLGSGGTLSGGAGSGTSGPSGPAGVFHGHLSASLSSPQWSGDLSGRVTWLARHDGGAARLELTPPDLGPVHVQVSVRGEHAQVSLHAHHPLTRDALELTSDRLREALSAEGFGAVDVEVGAGGTGAWPEQNFEPGSFAGGGGEDSGLGKERGVSVGSAGALPALTRIHPGLVDRYV